MKKLVLVLSMMLVLVSFLAAENVQYQKMTGLKASKNTREEIVHYTNDFEGTLGWNHYDGSLPAMQWHLINNANLTWQGTGYSWFPGQDNLGTNGGYIDRQYVVLDTPEINVPSANPTLTFKMKFKVEALGNSTGYNGWDGMNVRISTNNGQTWTVLSGAPAYNSTSMYAFGFHGEGTNVPGWGGSSTSITGNQNGWLDASFNLATYAGQNVKIRFAFASDPAYSTGDDASMFGWIVDNIALGTFNYDFNDNNAHGMTPTTPVPAGGDLWHIAEYAQATSPSHVLACSNDQNSYNIGMMNYIETESIPLPTSNEIRADFQVRGLLTDPNEFPEVDYWGWEISIDNGATWRAMSNPYADPNGQNFVYSDVPETFVSFVEAYSTDGYISNFSGQSVKFRWYLRSDADTPEGEGLMIDDFKVFYSQFAPAPTALTAVRNGNAINLDWTSPGAGGQTGWIHYDSGENENGNGVGLTNPAAFDCAAKFPADFMLDYAGGVINKIKFFPIEAVPFSVRIWTGANGTTQVLDQAVTTVTPMEWNEIILTNPVTVQAGTDYWIGYNVTQQAADSHPAGMDETPHTENGEYIRLNNGAWQSIFAASSGAIDGNWNIQGYVDVAGKSVVLNDRDVDGFKVYRTATSGTGYTMIGEITGNTSEYSDNAPLTNAANYYVVSTMWDNVESAYSNEASEFMPNATTHELMYHDGQAENGIAITGMIASKFTPNYHGNSVKVAAVKYYVHTKTANALQLKVWSVGTNGMPGNELFSVNLAAAQIVQGWNYLIIPQANQPELNEGDFFIGFQMTASSSKVGLDTNTNGRSYNKVGTTGTWTAITTGNYMINAFYDNGSGSSDIVINPALLTAKNYPNPFNPETTINFNMPADGKVSVKIYNAKGQLVKTLFNGNLEKGSREVVWNGVNDKGQTVGSGLYFYKVETAKQSIMNKMILMK